MPSVASQLALGGLNKKAVSAEPQIVNLIRVPGVHQVLLQVRVAELNRTALREIGADVLGVNPNTGDIMGTNIAGTTVSAASVLGVGGLVSSAASEAVQTLPGGATAFGIFPSGNLEIMLHALRQNSLLSIMAEPNLVAINGQKASSLAGGQFPVPVAQYSGPGASTVTIEWKDFGVLLNFVPYVLEDKTIRMTVAPEVSLIDETIGVQLYQGGTITPGLNTRRAATTVEMRQGQTLAIAGLLQVQLDATTNRIPGLGDLPYIGPLFSNNSHKRIEKELLVLVTPYLASPMNSNQVPSLPGADIKDPTDWEMYLKGQIIGRSDRDRPSTSDWDDPLRIKRQINLERNCFSGPVGFSQ
ncbi:MAG: type II and III secretion system protein family protein [Thermoguttaceae bacterium]